MDQSKIKRVKPQSSQSAHRILQKSTTLNRKYVKRPATSRLANSTANPSTPAKSPVAIKPLSTTKPASIAKHPTSARLSRPANHANLPQTSTPSSSTTTIQKSPAISRYGKIFESSATQRRSPGRTPAKSTSTSSSTPATHLTSLAKAPSVSPKSAQKTQAQTKAPTKLQPPKSPLQTIVDRRLASRKASAKQFPAQPSAQELKDRAIKKALASVATMNEPDSTSSTPITKRRGDAKHIIYAMAGASICVAILGFFIHLNMPDISVQVASAQTGIEASYPAYIPQSFRLANVYSDTKDEITIEFNGDKDRSFHLIESKSTWDSSALLNNYVKENWGEHYSTIREQGITIYVAKDNIYAVWVNGGHLFKLDLSHAQLSKEQIKNIATSLQ